VVAGISCCWHRTHFSAATVSVAGIPMVARASRPGARDRPRRDLAPETTDFENRALPIPHALIRSCGFTGITSRPPVIPADELQGMIDEAVAAVRQQTIPKTG
jgi:hypothetical protein